MHVAQREAGLADRYDALLAGLPLILPGRGGRPRPAWHLYASVGSAEGHRHQRPVFAALRDGRHRRQRALHPHPHPAPYRRFGFARGDFPPPSATTRGALSLPLFPAMTPAQQDRVVSVLRSVLTLNSGRHPVIPARWQQARAAQERAPLRRTRLMIAYAIAVAQRSGSVRDIVLVSTDDAEVAVVSRGLGADVPFLRPAGTG